MSLDYFQRFLQSYDGDSKEVREQLNNAIMREKTTPIQVYDWLLEGMLEETEIVNRRAEINNLFTCIRDRLQLPEGITQDVIDRIKDRVYNLIANPDSSGKHDFVI